MRFFSASFTSVFIATFFCALAPVHAQQAPESFRWVDFHSPAEADTIAWVTRSLAAEKWTAIREIGVQYDAALVVTTLRPTPQSLPGEDSFTVWSLSLTNHSLTPLIHGANLRLIDWMLFADGAPRELAALYDDCNQCAASTFFTAFHYDLAQHGWAARWMRGTQAAPLWSANTPKGAEWEQVYALLSEPNGRQVLGTWSRFDSGKQKSPDDVVFRYDLDPFSLQERTQLLSTKEAEAFKQRLCAAQSEQPGLARGQDSPLCQQTLKPQSERKPVTTPPANNHGRSTPPKATSKVQR
jgi:hypothetical protein